MKFNKELQGRAGRNLAHEKYAVLWDFVFGSYSQYNNKELVSLLECCGPINWKSTGWRNPLRWLNTVLAVSEYIGHLPNYGKRKVAAHKLKLGKWKIYWWKILTDGKIWRFRSFHGNMND